MLLLPDSESRLQFAREHAERLAEDMRRPSLLTLGPTRFSRRTSLRRWLRELLATATSTSRRGEGSRKTVKPKLG